MDFTHPQERMQAATASLPLSEHGTFGRMLVLAISASALLACAAQPETSNDYPAPANRATRSEAAFAQLNEHQVRIHQTIWNEIDEFTREGNCRSEHLQRAIELSRSLEGVSDERGGDPEIDLFFGSLTLDIADAASGIACNDAAESIYNHVIARYSGSEFAALRQRAELGIARLN